MWDNSKHLLAFCVVCGAVGSYLISVYVLLLAFVVCVWLFVIDAKSIGQSASAIRNFTFPVPCWIKSTITFLMNSYHLSKPLETESGSRRSSPYSPNISVPRRPSCRTGRFACLDENTDYANRRNGIGLCNPGPAFNNSYSNSLHGFRRHSGFNDSENSSKIEEFSTPQTSPWTRRQNYSGNEFSNVRRVQTVAGPLLATSGLTKRKSNDFGLYVDANSPGLASRIVQYREEGASSSDSVWTHQPQYNSPGQFPMVHLSHSPSSLPVLSPLSSQKASRRSVRVKIAPPDPLGSRLYPLSTKNNASLVSTIQTDQSMKSVLETLKEISRKRIHSQLEDNDDDAAKRKKRSGPPNTLGAQTDDNSGEGENVAKRLREDSPRQQELSPPTRPMKRICNNEILSSLSSSRKLLQGGIKRKTHSLDWSRCSTPVLGKQQKTGEEALPSLEPLTLGVQCPASSTQPLLQADDRRPSHPTKNMKTPLENGKRIMSSMSSGNFSGSVRESQKNSSQVTQITPKATKASSVGDTPWQKDSPFVTVSSADDIIDDVTALEEKREEDRRSRLMAMMTVINGGEPPVKTSANAAIATTRSAMPSAFSVSGTAPPMSDGHIASLASETPLLASALASVWSSSATNSTTSTVAIITPISSQSAEPIPNQPANETTGAPTLLNNAVPSSSMFTFGNSASPVASSSVMSNNTNVQSTVTSSNTQLPIAPVFESLSAQVPTPLTTPVSSPMAFGSTSLLFGSKAPENVENTPNSQYQPIVSSATISTSENLSYGTNSNRQVSFGALTSPVAQSTSVPTSTLVSTVTSPVASSSVFQLHSATSGIGKDNSVTSSSGFVSASSSEAAATSEQTNTITKTLPFGTVEKPALNSPTTMTSGTLLFGSLGNPSATATTTIVTPIPTTSTTTTTSSPASFVFGSSGGSVSTTGPQIKPGLFSFGSTAVTTPSSQTASNSSTKSIFGSNSGSFGQAVQTSAASTVVPNQSSTSHIATSKAGGFAFDLASEKAPIVTPSSSSTTNVFGNASTATNCSEPKPFTFSSAKLIENPFALNTSRDSSAATISQAQTPVNLFGTSTSAQKPSETEKLKEKLFSFGGSSTASPGFSAPQMAFSSQPAVTTAANNGFSFPTATPSGFSQPQSGAGGFSVQIATAPAATFGTPATSANSAFGFGSPGSNPAPQSNMFAFGSSSGASDPQSGGMFSFGSGSGAGGSFGRPSVPAAPIQSPAAQAAAAAPASTFQFGAPSVPQPQVSGTFSFGASSTPTPASAPAFSSGGSFQMNASGFGSGPAMFSIGSGSTAPRARSARARRTK